MRTSATIVSDIAEIPGEEFLRALRPMPRPKSVVMCPPTFFDVVDVKNPLMKNQVGKVNRRDAQKQWEAIRGAFEAIGTRVEVIPAVLGCEDMVFSANQVFVGMDETGNRICVLSRMKFPSRQEEVAHFGTWFRTHGYEIRSIVPAGLAFEGGGDAIWHPGRALIWGGYGYRTDPAVYPLIADVFAAPVIKLELSDPCFYHLDTCFCPLNETTVLVHLPALSMSGQRLVHRVFPDVIEVEQYEARALLACNAAVIGKEDVFLQRGSDRVVEELSRRGFKIHQVETREFMKSGGSVFCVKTAIF